VLVALRPAFRLGQQLSLIERHFRPLALLALLALLAFRFLGAQPFGRARLESDALKDLHCRQHRYRRLVLTRIANQLAGLVQ
jgi:hypothetical protein